MALIKCIECGQELSTEARVCPHCGNPNVPVVTEQKHNRKETIKAITGFIILGLAFWGAYQAIQKFENLNATYSGRGTFLGNLNQDLYNKDYKAVYNDIFPQHGNNPAPNSSNGAIQLQEVKNLGYDFFIGQIDSPNTNNLTDDMKNQITKIAYTAHFPVSLLKNVPIIILNNLALTGNQYIPTASGNLKVPDLKADWLSEGGIYVTFDKGLATIFINKPIIAQGQLTEVLTHELGHAVGATLTDADWQKYYSLRGIPASTSRQGTNWNLSPAEDFAEVYKNTYTGIAVRTYYGELVPSIGGTDLGSCMTVYLNAQTNNMPQSNSTDPLQAMLNPTKVDYTAVQAKANSNPSVQACRRGVMTNPSAHSSDWAYGTTPYVSIVTQATKDFIIAIVTKLNQ